MSPVLGNSVTGEDRGVRVRNWVRGPVLACWVWEIRAIALPAGFAVSWEAERDVPRVSAGCGSLLQPPWGGGVREPRGTTHPPACGTLAWAGHWKGSPRVKRPAPRVPGGLKVSVLQGKVQLGHLHTTPNPHSLQGELPSRRCFQTLARRPPTPTPLWPFLCLTLLHPGV